MRIAAMFTLAVLALPAQETLFSGPQPGEPLKPFTVLAVNGAHAGKEVDFISQFGNEPILLIFAHYIDRNVYRVLWPCDRYASEVPALKTLFVYLAPDRVEGERRMQQVVKSLSLVAASAVSVDGVEGPGAYGLNKQAGVTAILAKNGRVVFNRAIVQPGQSEAQRIVLEAIKLAGGNPVTDLELARGPLMRRTLPPGAPTAQQIEAILGVDPPEVAAVVVRLTLLEAPEITLNQTVRDLRGWAGTDESRRRLLASRLAEWLKIMPNESARARLLKEFGQ